MNHHDQPTLYQPWRPDDYAEPEPPVSLPPDCVPAVPAHSLPRALSWTAARALRRNPGCGVFPVDGYVAAPKEGGAVTPPEAAVFDLTAITLQAETETRTLEPDRRTTDHPDPMKHCLPEPDLTTPRISRPQAIILSVAIRYPNGAVASTDIPADLLVTGDAEYKHSMAAFTAGDWPAHRLPDLPDLICQALWDWHLMNASSEEFDEYNESIRSIIDYWLERNVANPQNPDTFLNIPQVYDAQPPKAASR